MRLVDDFRSVGRRGVIRVSQIDCNARFAIRRLWDRDDYFARRISRV